jgi:hypothetical protein
MSGIVHLEAAKRAKKMLAGICHARQTASQRQCEDKCAYHNSVSSGRRGRTASCLTAPSRIPACSFSAPGSSELLASALVRVKLSISPTETADSLWLCLPWPTGRLASRYPSLSYWRMFPLWTAQFCRPLPPASGRRYYQTIRLPHRSSRCLRSVGDPYPPRSGKRWGLPAS